MSIDSLIRNTIRSDVLAVPGYHVADASGFIKLDAMENPYPLPEHLASELAERLAGVALNRYPVASYGAPWCWRRCPPSSCMPARRSSPAWTLSACR
jgi:histidinol-phosphate aminotransferase